MSIASLMSQTLTIRRLVSATTSGSTTTDPWGHPGVVTAATPVTVEVRTYVDYATVRGLVQERTGQEVQGPQLQGTVVANAVIFLPFGTDVTTQDRVRNVADGFEYDVLYVKNAAGRSHHLECDARRVEG